jgi:hypothetical protein
MCTADGFIVDGTVGGTNRTHAGFGIDNVEAIVSVVVENLSVAFERISVVV